MKEFKVETGISGLDELIEGFPRGGLIIVAGRPGTGKTVFGATFLYNGAVKYGERGVHASFAEDKESFYDNMAGFGMDFRKLEEKGLFRYVELPTVFEASSTLMKEILEVVQELNAKRLVIDSFTAISQFFKDPNEVRVLLHTILSKMVKQLRCTTILIEEIPHGVERIGHGYEEFVADGVIFLDALRFEDKNLRELRIAKMRGSELRFLDACFTLHGGFRVFGQFRIKKIEKPRRFEPLPDPPGMYSTGMPALDDEIGGLPKGSTILLEIDRKLKAPDYQVILAPIIANYVSHNRPLIIIPSSGTDWRDLINLSKLYGFREDCWKKVSRILEREEMKIESAPPFVVSYAYEDLYSWFEKMFGIEEELMRSLGAPPLRVIGADTVAQLFGQESLTQANLDVHRTKVLGALTIWISKPIRPRLSEMLAPMAHIHLKLTRRHGCLLFYGIKPRTPLYAVEMDVSRGYPLPRLTPIV